MYTDDAGVVGLDTGVSESASRSIAVANSWLLRLLRSLLEECWRGGGGAPELVHLRARRLEPAPPPLGAPPSSRADVGVHASADIEHFIMLYVLLQSQELC